jgi:carboxypeptidase C (cathepsin A)
MKVFASVLTTTLVLTAQGTPDADEVTSLPGWDAALPSKQYSGYLTVNETKHMHYWMVESENDPSTDPVVLWLNGGPGCSSLDGYLYEHGPFHVDDDDYTKLVRFNETWASVATMIYLEAPTGVGFSYSDDASDYNTNDDQAAADNMAAIEAFFASFPQYAENDFFIAGESYAGVYVPTLAEAIMNADAAGTYTGAALKGIAVGNGCTGTEVGSCGGGAQGTFYETEYLAATAFIPRSLKNSITDACDWEDAINNNVPLSVECDELIIQMHETVGNINIYNVFGECISGSSPQKEGSQQLLAQRAKVPKWMEMGPNKGPNPCIDSYAASGWINQPDVIAALHVVPQSYDWSICGNQIHYTSTRPNLPRDTYPALNDKYRVLVYNGDWDACVPYTDNEGWTEGMGYEVKTAWHPWLYNSNQVGGYATTYNTANNFTFITVRGGRHEVPETQPVRALQMFKNFISNTVF